MSAVPQTPNCYAGRRVIVTGAAGFIGRWVARRLSKAGAELFLPVLDGAFAGRVFACYDIRGTMMELDVARSSSVKQTFREIQPAVLFQLAGYGVNRSERDEAVFTRVNAELPEELAGAMAESGDQSWPGMQLVHAGSIAEYGPIGGDFREESSGRPATLYGKSKLAGTLALSQHCRRTGVRGLTARLATVYGPGEHAGRLLPTLIAAAETSGEIALSAGVQKRDFTYVEDVADGLLRLGLARAEPGDVVNLVTGTLTTVRRFAETAAAVLGIAASRLQFGALPARADEEMEHLPIATGKLRKLTGWTPSVAIAEGVRRTAEFLAARPAQENTNG